MVDIVFEEGSAFLPSATNGIERCGSTHTQLVARYSDTLGLSA